MTSNNESFNEDELEPPLWLNEEFLTKVLKYCENDETIELISFRLSPATVQGDHYASVMFRACVKFTTTKQSQLQQSISMIIKTMPEVEGNKKEMLDESFVFETENGIYSEVIPKFESILSAAGDQTKLGARCLYHSLAPKKLIVFEDLVPLGYIVLRDRQVYLEEAKLAYLKLAKWHAVSYKVNQEDPHFFDKYRYGMLNDGIMENDFITGGIDKFIDMLDTQPTLKKFKPHFEAIKPNLIENCRASFDEYRLAPQPDAHYVLCHGDVHCKNMMFKHNVSTGYAEDVILLDYQIAYVGPIVKDVIYSIFMLMDRDLRKHHKDELIYFYFSNFIATLQRIDFNGRMPKLIEFQRMLLEHRHWEIFLLVTFLPIWYSFREGQTDSNKLIENGDYRKKLYMNPEYIEELEQLLPKYLYMGYFDD